jgi:urea transporter
MIRRKIYSWLTIYFEDISQCFFFRNRYFGFLLLVLLFFFDRNLFLGAVTASLIAWGYTLHYSTPKILKDSGLITINGFFFGLAVAGLFKASPAETLCLILGALSIPLVTKAAYEVLLHWKLSVFIVPYIFTLWVLWMAGIGTTLEVRHDIWPEAISSLPALHLMGANLSMGGSIWIFIKIVFHAVFESMGRLLFLPNAGFGLALLFLVTLFSPRRGSFFLIGTLLATLLAALVSGGHAWEYGFFSYSAGLVGLGLASSPEKISTKSILLFCLISCFLTLASDPFLRSLKLPVLSLPYVITMWIAILSRTPRVTLSWAAQIREEQKKAA